MTRTDRPLASRVILPVVWLSVLAMCGGHKSSASPSPTPTPAPGPWTLTWSDEFDGADGSRPDESRWAWDVGGDGWGNRELQTYTTRADNAVIQQGNLVITARAEHFTGADGIARDYTSGRLRTQGRFVQTYGRFEA